MTTNPFAPDFIAQEWADFQTAISSPTSETMIEAIGVAFYAGAMSMHAAVLHMLDHHDAHETAAFLKRTDAEFDAFSRTLDPERTDA